MKVRMYQVLDFETIYNKIKDIKMPIKTTYNFAKLAREINEEKLFYQQELQRIIDNFGERDENGNFVLTEDKSGVQIKKENLNECQKEIIALSNLEVEIKGINLNIDELENVELTLPEMEILMAFIEE